ncbi:guanylate kinase [Mycobacterium ahvazicum]|uniref:Guanylate kinase n=1 Tax=Mycobacterium ahvazicum TaxID=1964395 RepID=A0A2K4Y9K8_9MYCO|nr:guanylate kinase [Mycobacterium ahvazicum]
MQAERPEEKADQQARPTCGDAGQLAYGRADSGAPVNVDEGPDAEHHARAEPSGMGRVVVLSGPSAVGKSTVVRCLRERVPNLHFSVSATTRAPRPGEVDGVDYHFVSPARFQQLIDEGALLEWAEIHGGLQRSGTPAAPVRAATGSGFPVLIEVDLAGARAIKKAMPEAVTVFLAPPSWADLEARLRGRGTETPEAMARRLETAREELAAQDDFDQVVVNSQLESACAELVSLLVGNAPGAA